MHEDMRLLERWHAGDRVAGDRLVRKYRDSIYRFAFGQIRDADVAEEITQSVFTTVIGNLDRIREHVRGYVYGVCRRKLQEYHRRRAPPEGVSDELVATDRGLSSIMALAQKSELLVAALRKLPLQDQRYLALHYVRGQSQQQLATRESLRASQIHGRMARARRRLRGHFEAMEKRTRDNRKAQEGFRTWLADVAGDTSVDGTS